MKVLHLICRLNPETNRGFGIDAYDKKDPPSWVRNDTKNIFTSGFWVCGTSEATELVGGRLHLHENKTEIGQCSPRRDRHTTYLLRTETFFRICRNDVEACLVYFVANSHFKSSLILDKLCRMHT